MSSGIMNQQQIPINGTILKMAPPGNETNIYHIPVANLPWHTSWQQLKDHVRTVCPVERVEVHDVLGGVVVVKGRANYEAAYRLLNGGIFNGRSLIAEGNNADQWVPVRHRVDAHPSSQRSPTSSRHVVPAAQQVTLITSPVPVAYGELSTAAPVSSYMMSPTTVSPLYMQSATTVPEHHDPTAYYGMSSPPTGSVAVGAYSATPQFPQQEAMSMYHHDGYNMSHSIDGNAHVTDSAYAKKWTVTIRKIQPWATLDHIYDLVYSQAGSVASQLQNIDLPLADSQNGTNCGYATATLNTESAAEKLVRRLNNTNHMGRILEVRHIKEGAADCAAPQERRVNESSHRRSHHSGAPRRERRGECRNDRDEREERDDKGREKKSSSSRTSDYKNKHVSSTEVVIAHGSSPSASRRHEGRETSRRH